MNVSLFADFENGADNTENTGLQKLGAPTTNVFCQYFVEEAKVNEKTVSLAMVCDYYFFSTRQHTAYMLSALYAITRPSVCLSVT